MWSRSRIVSDGLTHVKITATFDWDSGDPSVGIRADFGENTCVEITAGPFRTWITWRDYTFTVYRNRGRYRRREEIEVDGHDPATWVIDTVETEYTFTGDQGGPLHSLGLADYRLHEYQAEGLLTLSLLPDVLAVVVDAFAAYKASERLSAAQENVQMLEEEVAAVKWHIAGDTGGDGEFAPSEHDTLKLEELTQALSEAREEAQAAHDNARARGITP